MIYAIGDIHGHLRKLEALIAKLPLKDEDQVVFLGDYVDRGPQSKQVLDLLIDWQKDHPGTIFLRGNHEQMMLDTRDAYAGKDRRLAFDRHSLWAANGGAETLDSYPVGSPWWNRIPDPHWDFITATVLEYWCGPWLFVHAGVLPPDGIWPYAEDPRLWVREEFLDYAAPLPARVIFGHTPQRSGNPLVMHNKIGIDTGAVFGGPLTAIAVSSESSEDFAVYQA